MFKAGFGTSKLDLYDWLPPYGENSVSLFNEGLMLSLSINYDGENSILSRKLIFEGVCNFYQASFPGLYTLNISHVDDKVCLAGAVIEYENSEAARFWSQHLNGRDIKHFRVIFLSENVQFEIFASQVKLTDPIVVDK